MREKLLKNKYLPKIIQIFVFPRLSLLLSLFQEFPQFFNGILQLEGVVTVVLHNPLVEVHVRLLRLVEVRQLGAADTALFGQGNMGLVLLQETTRGTKRPEESQILYLLYTIQYCQELFFNILLGNIDTFSPACESTIFIYQSGP